MYLVLYIFRVCCVVWWMYIYIYSNLVKKKQKLVNISVGECKITASFFEVCGKWATRRGWAGVGRHPRRQGGRCSRRLRATREGKSPHSLQSEGAPVTILALDYNLEEAKTSIKLSTGSDVIMLKADVCDFEAVKEADQGVFVAQEVEKQDVKEIESMIDVILVGMFRLVKVVLQGMKNRKHRKPVSIVFMSSQAGQVL
ncbi:putative 3-dehydrosphinganine reductase [Helianthus annuus]|nr:putative 3-dehydrosphinganine reductase [Helianthus annuus]